jgi:hypothetical protein
MPIVVNLACGLANRMFQYSYYLYLKKKGYDVKVDYYTISTLAHEDVQWNRIFPMANLDLAKKWDVFRLGGGSSLLSKIRRRYLPYTCKVQYMPTAFSIENIMLDAEKYIFGVFQNASMVDDIKEDVQRLFSFASFEDGRNKLLENRLKLENSIGIHVRKGNDYTSRIWYQNTCTLEYYRNAISYIKERVENPQFYVFADNPEWVQENFKEFDYYLVECNPTAGWGSHFDMQLMSSCKHNIISNSTYSWWGAFLNKNEDKIVILPKQWFNPLSCDESTSEKVQCKDWIAL